MEINKCKANPEDKNVVLVHAVQNNICTQNKT